MLDDSVWQPVCSRMENRIDAAGTGRIIGELMQTLLVISILLSLGIAVLIAYLFSVLLSLRRDIGGQNAAGTLLQQQILDLRSAQDKLGQNLVQNLQAGQQTMAGAIGESHKSLLALNQQLGQLQANSQRIIELSGDIRSLQMILQSPKLRGQMGEYSLENLLKNILPADAFSIQHTFQSGRKVDALVHLADYSVCVDAKFPLPSFAKMMEAAGDEDKAKFRRTFQNDVIKHIDKIAESYILPQEKTLDFALMYIPAENVYYETVVKNDDDRQDIMEYALNKKVIPVSPNLFYVYLMTVVMGLRGLAIEKQAEQIRTNLQKLTADWGSFAEDWRMVGSHLRNAYNKHDEGQKKLERFGMQLEQIQSSRPENGFVL